MITQLIFSTFLAMQPEPSQLNIQTGRDIIRVCEGSGVADLICRTWIQGVLGGIDAQQMLTDGRKVICQPELTDILQVRDAILAFVRENPRLLDIHAAGIAHAALRRAFPCPLGGNSS